MIDLNRSLGLIKGALFDPEATWKGYLPESDNWKKTAALLTGPLIVLSALLGYVLGLLSSGVSVFGFRPTIVSTIAGIISGAIAMGVIAFIASYLAGVFGGKSGFARGLAAISLAFVPGYLGQALGWLPWIGTLVALALFVYALVLLWRIIPIYLEVPDDRRAGHYIATILLTIIVMMVLSFVLRPLLGPASTRFEGMPEIGSNDRGAGSGGMLSNVMRQAEIMEAAEEDRYQPPSDSELDEDQVEEFIRVMQRAEEIMNERGERMRELAERAERDEEMSMSDMSELMAGATQVMGLNTIEMEIVKSSGRNWAEHQWVKEALRTAYVQRDINDAVKHNYELYKKHEDELESFVNR